MRKLLSFSCYIVCLGCDPLKCIFLFTIISWQFSFYFNFRNSNEIMLCFYFHEVLNLVLFNVFSPNFTALSYFHIVESQDSASAFARRLHAVFFLCASRPWPLLAVSQRAGQILTFSSRILEFGNSWTKAV